MKKMVLGLLAGVVVLSSCEKNNCYQCKLVIKDDAGVHMTRALGTKCRITRDDLDKMIKDSTRSYEGINYQRGGIKVTFNQTVECEKENYW